MKIASAVRRSMLLILGTAALSSLSFAIPICSSSGQSLASLVALGAGGCGVGTAVFSNFSLTNAFAGGAGVNPHATDTSFIQIAFNYISPNHFVTTSNSDAASWSVTGTQQFHFTLNYSVSTVGGPAYFNSFAASLSGATATGFGGVHLLKTINGTQAQAVSDGNQNNPVTTTIPFTGAPVSSFTVVDDLEVAASTSSASLTSFSNVFNTPEPMTSTLLGSGLLAFGYLLRRRRG